MNQIGSQYARAVMSSPAKPTIYVVDDDAGVLGSLRFLLETDGFAVRTFRSGAALLNTAALSRCRLLRHRLQDARYQRHRSGRPSARSRYHRAGDPHYRLPRRENLGPGARMPASSMCCRSPILDESLVKRIREAIQEGPRRRPAAAVTSGILRKGFPLRYRAKFSAASLTRSNWPSAAKEMAHAHPVAQHRRYRQQDPRPSLAPATDQFATVTGHAGLVASEFSYTEGRGNLRRG